MGGVGRVACQGFLVREACIGVLVGGARFLLSGLRVTLGSLYIKDQGYVIEFLQNLCGMSCSGNVGCWVVLGFTVWRLWDEFFY